MNGYQFFKNFICESVANLITPYIPYITKIWYKIIVLIVVLILLLKAFVIEVYKVGSFNMEDSYKQNDVLIINKLAYGARFPISILSIPFSNNRIYSVAIQIPYFRFPKLKNLKRNNVIAFNNPVENDPPIDKKKIIISRIMGLPGDTLKIYKKGVFVNKHLIENSDKSKFLFRITSSKKLDQAFYEQYNTGNANQIGNLNVYDFVLTRTKADQILNDTLIRYVRELYELNSKLSYDIFPYHDFFVWNKDFYGPIIIPQKGKTIQLNYNNIILYKRIIEVYEKNSLQIEDDNFRINGKRTGFYTFKQDYFFVLGDNRDITTDSRHWGFLPESHIIGRISIE